MSRIPRISPMMATTAKLPADDSSYAFEVKWDGVRALCYIEDGQLRMESRNLIDITPRYPELHGLASEVGSVDVLLDGEVVAFDERGRPSFGVLQHRMHVANEREVRRRMGEFPVALMLFDLLWLDGTSLVDRPYSERRAGLESLALSSGSWQVPTTHTGDGRAMLEATRQQGLEGVVAKRLTSVYEPGRRSRSWLKIKNQARQEVVIGGWLPGAGNRSGRLGALLAGYYEDGALRFAGKVGTGFSDRVLADLGAQLAALARDTSPFADPVPYKEARYVEPVLVADVEFTEWTAGGTMRHPSYKGLRMDKSATDVVREPL